MSSLESLNITPQKLKQFNNAGIYNSEDLLRFLPRKYYDFRNSKNIKDLVEGEIEFGTYKINDIKLTPKVMNVTVTDGIDTMNIVFFQFKYAEKVLKIGNKYGFYGKIGKDFKYNTQMINPVFTWDLLKFKKIMPIYSKISGMSDDYLKEKIELALTVNSANEYLDYDTLKQFKLIKNYEMERNLHQPKTPEDIEKAKERLVFDELFQFALITSIEYSKQDRKTPYKINTSNNLNKFLDNLPFKLTEGPNSQKQTILDIIDKMKSGIRTNSLIQGDVSCGKTLVALSLMVVAAENNFQSVLMAPTLVLAQQHYIEVSERIKPLGLKAVFLGGKLKAKEKREVLTSIKDGSANIIIGTHSVISNDVEYNNLGLAVVDEEHRFGVVQRKALENKTSKGVHCITMSATPIPRSLALTIYGDFVDVYTIKVMPNGRKKIITKLNSNHDENYDFIKSEINKGKQAYIICPLIEDSNSEKFSDIQSTENTFIEASNYFKNDKEIKIAQINGKMKQEEVNNILDDFKSNNINIIISTTIIEVGVNVPNATVILIKNSERFGLAQLHQLRGRVGRGSDQSYCILETPKEETERLLIMENSNDGFEIAKKDLELRGSGDFIGTKQTGDNNAVMLMLANPELYEKIKNKTLDIIKEKDYLPRYQYMIDDYNKRMGD